MQSKKQIFLMMAKEVKAKCYNLISGHSLRCQCVKKYDNIMEGDQSESDVEQNESDNDYSCETPRKKLNTRLDTMGISAIHLHGVAQHSRASTAKNKLDRAVEELKHYQMIMLRVLINFLALNLLLFLKLNKRHQSLIVCTI